MHFFRATLITFLYVACISAAPIDEPIDDVAAVDQVLKTHSLGDVVDTLPPFTSSAVASSATEIAGTELTTTLTCDTYIDEYQPEPADPNAFPINVTFLRIFELQGTVDLRNFVIQATLFVRVPFLGRVKVISFGGNLRDGVRLPVNTFIAKGFIDIRLANGKDVILILDLDVKFVGKVRGSVKLFTLPFAPEVTLPNVD